MTTRLQLVCCTKTVAVPVATPPVLPLMGDAALRALGWAPRRGLRDILDDTLAEIRGRGS